MRRVEKSARGMDLDGDVLRRDVAQRVIDFADQQLIAPAPTENEARENLLWYLFDRYMDHVAQGLDRLRDERQRLSRGKPLPWHASTASATSSVWPGNRNWTACSKI